MGEEKERQGRKSTEKKRKESTEIKTRGSINYNYK